MADRKQKARAEVRRAQAELERAHKQREKALAARLKSFERAREAGLTIREIAGETGIHFTRVAQILRGD
jgi:predicted transposase YdaD